MMRLLFSTACACITTTAFCAQAANEMQRSVLAMAAAPYSRIQEEFLQLHRELVSILENVHDKAGADKAAASIPALRERLRLLHAQEAKLPKAPDSVRTYLQEKHNHHQFRELCERGVGKALSLTLEQEEACYGSEQLQEALTALLNELCGGL